ncbi:MAG TPA: HD domain-containing phosphohydrolase [Anaeromyxobacteraceae bacterium]|jgi:putative nucleotidyltransferase with HDIG domain|nr:HD domain-containing phosphohydrolase [Anaeromyxobacteraceae bacterium]
MKLFRAILGLMLLSSAVPVAVLGGLLATRAELDLLAIGAGVFSVALSVALSAWFARRLTRPVRACVAGALEIARGRFGREVPVQARNEIGDLAYTFNHMSRELASYDAENRRLIAALEQGYLDTLRSLAGAIDAKDPYTRGHSQRVAALSVEIGRELGLPAAQLQALECGGLLHDVGKIGIAEPILRKAGALTESEMAIMRAHPVIGAEIVRGVEFLATALPGIRWHHERWDGAGYPDGLAGERIPLVARIVSAADVYDAMTSERSYQRPLTPATATERVASMAGTQIDPGVAMALETVLRRQERGAANQAASGAALAEGA